jgi:SAM-dependent methyltransferase
MSLTPLQRFAYVLRKMHLLHLADLFWFLRLYWLNRKANTLFRKQHPDVPVPPPMMLYDILGSCDLSGFYLSGQEHAHEISRIISAERPEKFLRILEWGGGPARVLQHLNSPDDYSWDLWGSDYNLQSISWCQHNWSDIHFIHHELEPPIPVENEFLDVIYCISVFTHPSEASHHQWVTEILRLLKPGGLFIGTFRGEAFRDELTNEEQLRLDCGELVIRDKIREGKKDYSAYHSDDFVRQLLVPFDVVKKLDMVTGFRQEVWAAIKNGNGETLHYC